ncbi:MAG: tetratricopeptide repeat protein [candidate division Zixibacteria bacterium]|nr:tetratricopeptide repeat protein [candidate division Zixibacteria bacterium]
MAECVRKEIAKLLHAYELGLLSDEDRARVEQHTLECDSCFQEIEQNAEAARLMRFDRDTRRQIREITREIGLPAKSLATRRSLWRSPLPILIVVGIAFLLVLKDWRVDIQPSEPVMAAENRLAILPFENLVQPPDGSRLGEVIANLLMTDLSQSSFLQVVSSQYLYDLTTRLRTSNTSPGDNIAKLIAASAKARWLLTGAITQLAPELVVTVQLVDVSSGTIKAAVQTSSIGDRAVFQAVDSLSAKIRQALFQPIGPSPSPARTIADITTASVEAYQEYIRGVDLYRKLYYGDAERHFRNAIASDTTFAIPYYYLSMIVPGAEGRAFLADAVKLSDGAGPRERYLIQSRAAMQANRRDEALDLLNAFVKRYPDEKEPLFRLAVTEYSLGAYIEAVKNLQEAIALDSAYGPAYNQLAYTYDKLGDLESAIRAIDRYIAQSPTEANPYDSRGDIYARNGKIDQAIESYRLALSIKPDLYKPLSNLGMMYLFKLDYVRAESCFVASSQSPNAANLASARLGLCYLPAYQGHFREALRRIDSTIRADSADAAMGIPGKLWFKAIIYETIGRLDSASAALVQSISSGEPTDWSYKVAHLVRLLVRAGNMSEARRWADSLRLAASSSEVAAVQSWIAEGSLAAAVSTQGSALGLFERAARRSDVFSDQLRLAQAYLDFQDPAKAVPILEKLSSTFTVARQFFAPESVKLYYYLGRTYDELHWDDKAVIQYRTFLTVWKTADAGLDEITFARDRLAVLENRP